MSPAPNNTNLATPSLPDHDRELVERIVVKQGDRGRKIRFAVVEEEPWSAVKEIGPPPGGIGVARQHVEGKPPFPRPARRRSCRQNVVLPVAIAIILFHVEHTTRDGEFRPLDRVEIGREAAQPIGSMQRHRVRNHRLGDVESSVSTLTSELSKIRHQRTVSTTKVVDARELRGIDQAEQLAKTKNLRRFGTPIDSLVSGAELADPVTVVSSGRLVHRSKPFRRQIGSGVHGYG